MTKQDLAKKSFAPGTSRGTRSRATLLANMARDLERQVAMGARLKDLRESRPDLTQQKIADAIGITVRGYQFYEAGDSGIDHDRVVALAELFGVTTKYLYDGEVEEPAQLDLDQLDRIEAMLEELLDIARAAMPLPDPLGLAEGTERLRRSTPGRTTPQEPAATRERRRRAAG